MSRLLYGQLQLAKIGAMVADESLDDCYKYVSSSLNPSVPPKKSEQYTPNSSLHLHMFMMQGKKKPNANTKKGKGKAKGGCDFEGPPGDQDEQMEVDVDSYNECVATAS